MVEAQLRFVLINSTRVNDMRWEVRIGTNTPSPPVSATGHNYIARLIYHKLTCIHITLITADIIDFIVFVNNTDVDTYHTCT